MFSGEGEAEDTEWLRFVVWIEAGEVEWDFVLGGQDVSDIEVESVGLGEGEVRVDSRRFVILRNRRSGVQNRQRRTNEEESSSSSSRTRSSSSLLSQKSFPSL